MDIKKRFQEFIALGVPSAEVTVKSEVPPTMPDRAVGAALTEEREFTPLDTLNQRVIEALRTRRSQRTTRSSATKPPKTA